MKQSELHWNRWQNEESLRIYQNHIKRIQEVQPCPELRQTKESRNRTRYVRHRQAAEAIKRQSEQRRIETGNKLLEERIAKVNQGSDLHKAFQEKSAKPTQNYSRRRQDPIKRQQLMVSNISLLRRIVSAKPFASRQEWAHERNEMKRYLKRLKRSREERRHILVQRDDLAMQAKKPPHSSSSVGSPKEALVKRQPTRPTTEKPKGKNLDDLRFARRLLQVKASAATQASSLKQNELRLAADASELNESAQVKSQIDRLEQEFAKLFRKKPQQGSLSRGSRKEKSVHLASIKNTEEKSCFLTQHKSPQLPPSILADPAAFVARPAMALENAKSATEKHSAVFAKPKRSEVEKDELNNARRLSVDIANGSCEQALEKITARSPETESSAVLEQSDVENAPKQEGDSIASSQDVAPETL